MFAVVLQYLIWDPKVHGVQPFDFCVVTILMSISTLALLFFQLLCTTETLYSPLSQGLAPTMVIARIAYGKSVDFQR